MILNNILIVIQVKKFVFANARETTTLQKNCHPFGLLPNDVLYMPGKFNKFTMSRILS